MPLDDGGQMCYSVDSEHRISTPETPRWPRVVRYLVPSLLKEFSPYYKGAALFLPKKLKINLKKLS